MGKEVVVDAGVRFYELSVLIMGSHCLKKGRLPYPFQEKYSLSPSYVVLVQQVSSFLFIDVTMTRHIHKMKIELP